MLVNRARDVGVVALWGKKIEGLDFAGVTIGGRTIRSQWIIGADGFHSRVRQWAGLAQPVWNGVRRIGLRQHYRVRPWTDFVEVYWRKDCQAYVTPVGANEVCVAMVSTKESAASDLTDMFPALASHLTGADLFGPTRGAISMSVKLRSVIDGRVALVGDASGSVDAVTGEGLGLAFRQANCLATALAAGDLKRYDTSHRRIGRMPRLIARTLLLLDGNDSLRRMAFRKLAAHPRIFSGLLAVHVGALRRSELATDVQLSPRSRADIDKHEASCLPQNNLSGNTLRKLVSKGLGAFVTAIATLLLVALSVPAQAIEDPALKSELLRLARDWEHVKLQVRDRDEQERQMANLAERAGKIAEQYENIPDPIVWVGIITSEQASLASDNGSPMKALELAKRARDILEKVEKTNPETMDAGAPTILGVLYDRVPGFPIGFGDTARARHYLREATKRAPDGLDANFFLRRLPL
jgi:hypothetical protein